MIKILTKPYFHCNQIVFKLKSADCKLDVIILQLDQCFANYEAQHDVNESIVMNPVKIIDAMKEIEEDLNVIQQEHKELLSLADTITNELKNACDQMRSKIEEANNKIIVK